MHLCIEIVSVYSTICRSGYSKLSFDYLIRKSIRYIHVVPYSSKVIDYSPDT